MPQELSNPTTADERSRVEVMDIKATEANFTESKQFVLCLTEHVEVSQVLLHAEECIEFLPSMKDRVIQVCAGRAIIESEIVQTPLLTNQVAVLAAHHTFSIRAVDEVSLICTLALPDKLACPPAATAVEETLDEALSETFPASDVAVATTKAT